MKQTTVEWLYERLERMIPRTALYNIDKEKYFNKSKEMEKKQRDDFAIGFAEWIKLQPKYKKIKKSGLDNCYIEMSSKELLEIYKKEKGL